ncbi:MAG: VOC family protein [Actinobacteria bacterium]|nr:VOC family protein [Actinomycetota bacterium]
MRIQTVSVFVQDQERALEFYTRVLGFAVAADVPVGEDRWLTVVDPERPDGTQLLLEPAGHPAVGPFTGALVADGIPFLVIGTDDIRSDYERMRADGVVFTQPPQQMGPVITAVFDDTCGNLLQLAQFTG